MKHWSISFAKVFSSMDVYFEGKTLALFSMAINDVYFIFKIGNANTWNYNLILMVVIFLSFALI